MPFNSESFYREVQSSYRENEIFIQHLKRKKPKDLDKKVHEWHDTVFSKINCLDCANCCKTTSPAFYRPDIERLARELKMKSSEFIDTYLTLDDDGVYMLKKQPCPFLLPDNYCMVYDTRPLACREYPHTKRKRIYQVLDLTLKNSTICPAVLEIIGELRKQKKED